MDLLALDEWLEAAPSRHEAEFREAMRSVLVAVGRSEVLRNLMALKGGILFALRFGGRRTTKDVDFSTPTRRQEFDVDRFLEALGESLTNETATLDTDIDCRIQGHEIKPPRADASFPTIRVRIGYARKGTLQHQHLQKKRAARVIKLECSMNEEAIDLRPVILVEGTELRAYDIHGFVAEKYRALLQQKPRNRQRRQDAHDLWWMIGHHDIHRQESKRRILESLIAKSRARSLEVGRQSIVDPEIRARSAADYQTLADEVPYELPDFDDLFDVVTEYYLKLPWEAS